VRTGWLSPCGATTGGHRLQGEVPVHVLWYGEWTGDRKGAIRNFLSSLNEVRNPPRLP